MGACTSSLHPTVAGNAWPRYGEVTMTGRGDGVDLLTLTQCSTNDSYFLACRKNVAEVKKGSVTYASTSTTYQAYISTAGQLVTSAGARYRVLTVSTASTAITLGPEYLNAYALYGGQSSAQTITLPPPLKGAWIKFYQHNDEVSSATWFMAPTTGTMHVNDSTSSDGCQWGTTVADSGKGYWMFADGTDWYVSPIPSWGSTTHGSTNDGVKFTVTS